jgi:hypothetical protein
VIAIDAIIQAIEVKNEVNNQPSSIGIPSVIFSELTSHDKPMTIQMKVPQIQNSVTKSLSLLRNVLITIAVIITIVTVAVNGVKAPVIIFNISICLFYFI